MMLTVIAHAIVYLRS